MLTPTESKQVYIESKNAGVPNYQLDKLYLDYLRAEYYNDPTSFEREKKIMLLIPMPHHNIIDVVSILNPIELEIKKNIEKYIERYEAENNSIVADEIESINEKLIQYANESISIQSRNTNGDDIRQSENI